MIEDCSMFNDLSRLGKYLGQAARLMVGKSLKQPASAESKAPPEAGSEGEAKNEG